MVSPLPIDESIMTSLNRQLDAGVIWTDGVGCCTIELPPMNLHWRGSRRRQIRRYVAIDMYSECMLIVQPQIIDYIDC